MKLLCIVSDHVRDAASLQREMLLSRLAGEGIQVEAIRTGESHSSRIYPSTCIGPGFRESRTLFRLWRRLRAWRPDVVHFWNPPGFLLGQCLRCSNWRQAVVVTAMTPPGEPRRFGALTLGRWLVPNETLAEAWRQWGVPRDSLRVIPPALPVVRSGADRQELLHSCQLPSHARYLLCVGPLTRQGGHRSALWAMDILQYLHDDFYLVIAGAGPELPQLREFAKNVGVAPFVRFVEDRIAPAALAPHAELLWEPATEPGITDTLLLAQACGKPLLAVADSQRSSMIHSESVEWLPPHDPPLWARRSHALLESRERRQAMGQAGLNWARERYAGDCYAARHIKQYERLLSTPDRGWVAQAA